MKKIVAVIMTVLTVFSSVFVVGSFAGTSKTLKKDTWTTVKANTYYKISISGEGYITLYSYINGDYNEEDCYGAIGQICNKYRDELASFCSQKKGDVTKNKRIFAVSKGTYYILVPDTYDSSYRVKYSFVSIKQPTNYCKAKAQTLTLGKTVKIYQTSEYAFTRWYKFTTTKPQKINISCTGGNISYYIMDPYGNYITSYDMSSKRMPAGTYYFSVSADSNNGFDYCKVISLKVS